MIQAVLFDFGQTLVDSADGFRTAEKDAETKIFQDLDLSSWPEFLSRYRELRQELHLHSNLSRLALWQAVYAHFDRTPDVAFLLQAEREYWETVKSMTQPFPEAREVLEQLISRYRLGMITNTQGQAHAAEHRLALFPELERFFQVVVVAGEGEMPPKPDPGPFHLCLGQLGVPAQEAVFVGDDWRIDIRGAQEVGLKPIWLQHRTVTRNWPPVETSVPIITSLEELPQILSTFEGASQGAPLQ
jgi:HAD superfamily hydrolase (TIGR01549 family)